MGLFLVWCHRLIYIVLSLCKHACKEICDVNPGKDPYPLLARSCDRWWPDVVTFTACKKSKFGLKGRKKAQCVSKRCKDLFERKKYFGVSYTLKPKTSSEKHPKTKQTNTQQTTNQTKMRNTNLFLLYKHQWNTKWAFARKLHIITREITCYLHTWRDYRRSNCIINRAFFTGVYIRNRILRARLWNIGLNTRR